VHTQVAYGETLSAPFARDLAPSSDDPHGNGEAVAVFVQDDPDADDAEAEVKVEWNPLRRVRGSAGPSGCHRRKEGWRMEDRSAAAAQQLMRMDAEDEALARQLAIEREAKKRMLRAAIEYGPY
jgi:hypothetical protein